jgi:hypothetical protein
MKIATPIIALFLGVPGLALAQSEIRIPTDAEREMLRPCLIGDGSSEYGTEERIDADLDVERIHDGRNIRFAQGISR